MKIRIIKAKSGGYWYADKIGEVFNVVDDISQVYRLSVEGGYRFAFKEDCEEVIEHNSQLYRKVDRPVREGDTVLITLLQHTITYEIRKVKEVPGDNVFVVDKPIIYGDDRVVGDDGTYGDDYDVLELIEQPVQPSAPSYAEISELLHEAKGETKEDDDIVEVNGKQYRKVKRKASVGELVVVTNATSTEGTYENGSVLTVTESIEESGYQYASIYVEETDLCVLDSEYHVLELVEQSGRLAFLTERDLLANLAQEVAELKRQLTNAQTDIADLEDRVDENEKDAEELIGRINDLGDGAEAAAVVPVAVIEKVIAELKVKQSEATLRYSKYENMGEKELAQFYDGKELGFKTAVRKIEEALRNG